MALYSLLLAKPTSHLQRTGMPKSIRWCSSSSTGSEKLSYVKAAEVGKKDIAADAGLDVNQFKEIRPKVSTSAAEVQNNVSPWYTLKGIFDVIKEKVVGNPQPQKETSIEKLCSTAVDSSASEVTMTEASPHIAKSEESQSSLKSSEVLTNSYNTKESISTCASSQILAENSECAVGTKLSELVKVYKDPCIKKLSEPKSTVQVAGTVMGQDSLEEMVQSGEISDNFKGIKSENRQRLLKTVNLVSLFESDRYHKEESDRLLSSAHQLLERKTHGTMNSATGLSSQGKREHQLETKTAISVKMLNSGSEVKKFPSLSNSSPNIKRIIGKFKDTADNGTGVAKVNNDISSPIQSFNDADGTSEGNFQKTDIEVILDCMKSLSLMDGSRDTFSSNVTDQVSKKCSDIIQPTDKLQNANAERRKTPLKESATGKKSNKIKGKKKEQSTGRHGNIVTMKEGRNLDIAAKGHVELKQHLELHHLTSKEDSAHTPVTGFTKGPSENKLLLRFLCKTVENSDIVSFFKSCGPVMKIQEVPSFEGSPFKDAFVQFRNRQDLQKAMKIADLRLGNSNAFMEGTINKIPIPDLIGDPGVPVMLVKQPTHTVKIKYLTHDIISSQLQEALSFCGSRMTIFFGSSSSVAYVEFENEDAKEKALAKHSINVSGRKLLIFRIDVPRTTIVRIQNFNPKSLTNILTICTSYGRVKHIKSRCNGLVDVHFELEEWPNMLNILNSLNGLEVDGSWWIAQASPIFPPEILQVLWNHPDERRHVKAAMHSLLRKLKQPVETAELIDLAAMHGS